MTRRSDLWFDRDDFDGWAHRAYLRTEGVTDAAFRGRPVIGICNTWSELVTCNAHLRDLAVAVKRGVLQAGGFPVEFPVLSLGEVLMKPTTMLYRNLMAMDVEESIRAYPLDGVVLLAGCDKTVPACLMGAASANVPAIMVTGGPMVNGRWRNEVIGSGTDAFRYYEVLRAGRLERKDWDEFELSICRSSGHCQVMGTASTMACVTEALGMALPGTAAIPAVHAERKHAGERAGRQIIELVESGLRPADVLTAGAFHNAIRVLHAVGGSTNGVLHLLALAGRVGVDLGLETFDELSRDTPLLVNLKPAGAYLMEDLHYAGGVPAVMSQLRNLLDLTARTVSGRTVDENIASAQIVNTEVISTADRPLAPDGALSVLRGNLCPHGAVIKHSAADPRLLQHEGPALVFDDHDELFRRIDDPELPVTADTVLVLRNAGPVGGPGMPEWGHIPIPKKLLEAGVRDMVRISDSRMSGTSFGAVVLHIAPEAAVGGPLALVRNGDTIRLDVEARRLDLVLDDAELDNRRSQWSAPPRRESRGYTALYSQHVLQADAGCDFDFLRGRSEVIGANHTYG